MGIQTNLHIMSKSSLYEVPVTADGDLESGKQQSENIYIIILYKSYDHGVINVQLLFLNITE